VAFDAKPLGELVTPLGRCAPPRAVGAHHRLISSFGERLSAPLLAATLSARGGAAAAIDAPDARDRRPPRAATCDRRRATRDPEPPSADAPGGLVPVVTGHREDRGGETTTLGRSAPTPRRPSSARLSAREVVI